MPWYLRSIIGRCRARVECIESTCATASVVSARAIVTHSGSFSTMPREGGKMTLDLFADLEQDADVAGGVVPRRGSAAQVRGAG